LGQVCTHSRLYQPGGCAEQWLQLAEEAILQILWLPLLRHVRAERYIGHNVQRRPAVCRGKEEVF